MRARRDAGRACVQQGGRERERDTQTIKTEVIFMMRDRIRLRSVSMNWTLASGERDGVSTELVDFLSVWQASMELPTGWNSFSVHRVRQQSFGCNVSFFAERTLLVEGQDPRDSC